MLCLIFHATIHKTAYALIGDKFIQNFISSRDGPVKSTENNAETKICKKSTLLWNRCGKDDKDYYLKSAAYKANVG